MTERGGGGLPDPKARATTASRSSRVAIVTTHWGDELDEVTEATRLLAGALARNARVDIVHMVAPPEPAATYSDSVFTVHRVPLHGSRSLRAGLLRAALATYDSGRNVPGVAAQLLEAFEGDAPDVPELLERLAPDAVVLAGHHQPWDIGVLGAPGAAGGPRVVLLPYLADETILRSAPVSRLVARADLVAVAHSGERRAVLASFPERSEADVVPVDCGFSVNRGAAANRLFGVRFFGTYVLTIRSFPPGGARWERSATHEVLRTTVGRLSVAEIDGERWRISDRENTLELPVSPSRVNLWRLMAHAVATVDLRPPGPIGRETIESMLLGTPVVVADHSAAQSHAADSNGGLWYRDVGELIDSVRVLADRRMRDRFAVQGKAWAERTHGQMDDFVERARRLVLGKPVG
ncbi:MAG: hypothetical protein JWO62_2655 [Acidimicrobiaceae bacterium]|jgi:hypothetical protein|nr:hypothetical protein [Acidimicrobiaceae bacterium]